MKFMLNFLLVSSVLLNMLWGSVLAVKVVRVYWFMQRHVIGNGYCVKRGWHLKEMRENYALFSRRGCYHLERDLMFVSGSHKVICEVVHLNPTNDTMSVNLFVGGAKVAFNLENSRCKHLKMSCGKGRFIDGDEQ